MNTGEMKRNNETVLKITEMMKCRKYTFKILKKLKLNITKRKKCTYLLKSTKTENYSIIEKIITNLSLLFVA